MKKSVATRRLEDGGIVQVHGQPSVEELVPIEKNLNDYVANIRLLPRPKSQQQV